MVYSLQAKRFSLDTSQRDEEIARLEWLQINFAFDVDLSNRVVVVCVIVKKKIAARFENRIRSALWK